MASNVGKISQFYCEINYSYYMINWLSVNSGCDFILVMVLELSTNGRLEVTWFSVPTTSGTVSVIQRDAKRNKLELTAPGSLNTCLMCKGQRWIFNVLTKLLWYTEPPSLGFDLKDSAILELKLVENIFVSSIRQPHDWQTKPLPTAPPWHSNQVIIWSALFMVTYINATIYVVPWSLYRIFNVLANKTLLIKSYN